MLSMRAQYHGRSINGLCKQHAVMSGCCLTCHAPLRLAHGRSPPWALLPPPHAAASCAWWASIKSNICALLPHLMPQQAAASSKCNVCAPLPPSHAAASYAWWVAAPRTSCGAASWPTPSSCRCASQLSPRRRHWVRPCRWAAGLLGGCCCGLAGAAAAAGLPLAGSCRACELHALPLAWLERPTDSSWSVVRAVIALPLATLPCCLAGGGGAHGDAHCRLCGGAPAAHGCAFVLCNAYGMLSSDKPWHTAAACPLPVGLEGCPRISLCSVSHPLSLPPPPACATLPPD